MTKRRSLTLLAVTGTEVVRADVSEGADPRLLNCQRAPRPAATPLAAAVELAISMGNGKGSPRTILLTDDVWTGIVDIDDRSIAGLEAAELQQMLKFETEAFSNLDPMHSHLAFTELAPIQRDTRRFWCTGIAAEMLTTATTAVALRGGKLVRLAHPLGLCGPAASSVEWIEFRESLVGAFTAPVGGALPRASIVRRSTTSDRWVTSLESSFAGPLPQQGWIDRGAESPASFAASLKSLNDDAALEYWWTGTARRLAAVDTLPSVAPPAPEASTGARTRVGAVAAVAVAGLCGLHYASVSWNMVSIRQQIAALEEPAEEKRKIDAERQAVEKEIAELEKTVQVIENQQAGLAQLTAHSDRFAELLRLIAAGRDENLVVDEISVHEEGLRLAGRAIRSDAATRLALHLSPRAAEVGWKVKAPTLEGENKLASGGPWQFAIDLVDAPPTPNAYDTGRTGTVASVRKPAG